MSLTRQRVGRIRRSLSEAHRVQDRTLNPNDEHMGSIISGNADPAIAIGLTLPPDIKIDRAGLGRVRVVVATS
jgi:hypothetical protein